MFTWTDSISDQLQSRQTAWLAALVAVGLLGWAAADTALRLRAGPFAPPAPTVTQPKVSTRPPAKNYTIQDVISAHLFGAAPRPTPKQLAANAPETQLKLTLEGVAAASNPLYSRAIISVAAADPKPYAVGQLVASSDARIRAINPKYVLLDRNGTLERLSLIQPSVKSAPATTDSTNSDTSRASQSNEIRKIFQNSDHGKKLNKEQQQKLNDMFNPFKNGSPSG